MALPFSVTLPVKTFIMPLAVAFVPPVHVPVIVTEVAVEAFRTPAEPAAVPPSTFPLSVIDPVEALLIADIADPVALPEIVTDPIWLLLSAYAVPELPPVRFPETLTLPPTLLTTAEASAPPTQFP
jgi:hypothetical protein